MTEFEAAQPAVLPRPEEFISTAVVPLAGVGSASEMLGGVAGRQWVTDQVESRRTLHTLARHYWGLPALAGLGQIVRRTRSL